MSMYNHNHNYFLLHIINGPLTLHLIITIKPTPVTSQQEKRWDI